MHKQEELTAEELAEKLKAQLLAYTDLRVSLFKANFTEKFSLIFSQAITGLIVLFLGFMFILFLSLVAGFYIGELLKSTVLGFGIVAAFYFIFLLLVLVLKKKMIQIPITNAIISLIYNDNE